MKDLVKKTVALLAIWAPALIGAKFFPEFKIAIFILIVLAGLISYGTIMGNETKDAQNLKK